jgi:uncharacterized 2Fe-2S/4Fe-4S cluster protein (DUF4445 family)
VDKFRVTFFPDNKTVEVVKDTNVLSAAISAGVSINSACAGDGVCGKCKVRLKSGKVAAAPSSVVTLEEKRNHIYLACQAAVHSDLEVEVLPESRLGNLVLELKDMYSQAEDIISACSAATPVFKHSPLASKFFLKLPKPSLDDSVSDLERLYRELRKIQSFPVMQTGLTNIRQLGELLRDSDWQVTVTLGKRNDTVEVVLVEPGDTSGKNYGLAFDIGTTTISGELLDLNTKKVLGTKAAYNKQASFGSDVISRIIYAREENGLDKLHSAVTETINHMILELTGEHNVDLNDVTCIHCAGNTTMMHLLFSVDPTYIRKEPYIPTANFLPTVRAKEAGININPRGLISCVPGVSSYVGGDTTSGVLSSGLYRDEELGILIDIGTNGEICLGNRDFLVACAASAGPAFEGSGLTCGMRASSGAIQDVKINGKDFKVDFETIGMTKPIGICGSGYIDLLAEMLQAGIIDKSGRIVARGERVRESNLGREFVVVFKEGSAASGDIVINEADIDNLKRAKAAIYSACAILVKHMDLDFSGVKRVYIAGGFGTSLNVEKAVKIGILPDLPRERFKFIGNSSLAGAREMLLSYEAQKCSDLLAGKITYFELSVDAGYMDQYMAALFFPHTDLVQFPSVKF